jgi:surface antigen
LRVLAVCIGTIVATPILQSVPASADQISTLLAQRQQLQQQVAALGGDKTQALQDLLVAENALRNTQAQINHNAALLADLQRQQATTRAHIDATRAEIDTQRHLLGDLTRGQYKQQSNSDGLSVIFSSSNFSQAVNAVMASQSVNRRIADTARKLQADEQALTAMANDLAAKQKQAAQVQAQLEQANGRLLAQVADHDARLASIDGTSQALLAKIAAINRQIAALQAPAPKFGGGGASCGNHFDYGYCTWYVANRRCIPWFGNAWEWYGAAQQYGYPVGQVARVGAVAVWDQRMSGYGHVAYVESVQGDGFTVSEMNYTAWGQVDTRFVPYSNPGPLTGFIYGK